MKLPLQVKYRNLEPTPAIESAIRRQAMKLDRLHPRIVSCRVLIEWPHHHRRRNVGEYRVQVDVTVPGAELIANRASHKKVVKENLYVALREAFHTAGRELHDKRCRQSGRVKRHSKPSSRRATARVVQDR